MAGVFDTLYGSKLIKEEKIDATCKKAFLIIFGLSSLIFLVFGWVILSNEKIRGGWFNGIFNGISIMWLPTILYIAVGGIIDIYLFKGSLFNCREKDIYKR